MEQASFKPRTPIIAVTANALKGVHSRYILGMSHFFHRLGLT